LIDARHLETASQSRVLVAISFHFVPERVGYLDQVLRSLAGFPVRALNVAWFTNTTKLAEQEILQQLFQKHSRVGNCGFRLIVESDLVHPYLLTWCHKRLIVSEFLVDEFDYTHFVYLEDDEPLTFDNLAYFVAARDFLRPSGLLPAFLRTEWSAARRLYVNHDNTTPIVVVERPFIRWGDYLFINPNIPYCGAFVLDKELALEYAASLSFDPTRSREVCYWGVRERAAMGLSFEAPPPGFPGRVVVPVSFVTREAPRCAWLAHTPNNYADRKDTPLAKIPMTDLFRFARNAPCPCGSGKRYKQCHGRWSTSESG